jgi:tetratricopeptide (TPR) repeat protein
MKRVLSVLAVLCVTGSARADTPPTAWDRARDPKAAEAYDLHQQVAQMMIAAQALERAPVDRDVYVASLEKIRVILEKNDAASSKNPLLRYDLADVYDAIAEDHVNTDDYRRAANIYKATIAAFPDHPATARARLRLAFACGHLGDNACELECYTKILQTESEERFRATPLLNLAETYMHLGDLKEAVMDYREAIRVAGRTGSNETVPLATWGLAVALDRSGDRIGAEREARFAVDLERSLNVPDLLTSKGVFFYPEYEIRWYKGLGAVVHARSATRARDVAAFLSFAERQFADYIKIAEPLHDRWVEIAKVRLRQIKEERVKAERNMSREKEAFPGSNERGDVTL